MAIGGRNRTRQGGRDSRDRLASASGGGTTTISLSPSTFTLTSVGATQLLTPTIANPAGATTWSSSNTAIATVDQSGLVTAVAAGSATITAINGTAVATAAATVSIADLRPRFALGAATVADLTAFLASMTPIAGSANDSVVADFVVPTQTISQYGWLATTATADAAATLTAPSGRPKFYAALAGNTTNSQTIEEGWNGAGATGPGVGPGGAGADNKLTATISGVAWNFRRQVYPGNTSDTWFTRR